MEFSEIQIIEYMKVFIEIKNISSFNIFCVIDCMGYLRWFNDVFQETSGYRTGELLSKPLLNFTHPLEQNMIVNEINKLIMGAKYVSFVNRHRCKDGTYKRLKWIGVPDFKNRLTYAIAREI